jgi:hypothetical protein
MLRIIGDVHGKMEEYKKVAQRAEYSLQLGDMGFDYDPLKELDFACHQFFGGNHDNYDTYYSIPHSIGDYGTHRLGEIDFFFMRGSVSIDCLSRVYDYFLSNNKTWWYEEELTMKQLDAAIDSYETIKPEIMITHDCPSVVKNMISNPNVMQRFGWPEQHSCLTQQALQTMFSIHQPKLWFFGHFHRTWTKQIGETKFFCINELDYYDLDSKMNVSKGRWNKTAKH